MCKLFEKIRRKFDKTPELKWEHAPVATMGELEDQPGFIALVVGHNSKSQGAVNYLGESEFNFSSRILKKVQKKLKYLGYASVVIFRPHGRSYASQVRSVVAQCKKLNVTHAILSHFNSAGKNARGCEFLVPVSHAFVDNNMADMATDLLNESLGIKERRNDGVYEVTSKHRGAQMMWSLMLEGIHNTLAEPVFAKYRNEESVAIFENEDAYVDILTEVAQSCCDGTITSYNKK